ncbi:hypothetical protein DL95DRAFT_506689 [Leptodontidium sp. 2 PMI_412]|nr:hypothetical protein DL95DRAFT_506689 [Leptodontidium sp. 2 PMI_412]
MAGRAVTQHGLQSPEPSLGPDPKRNAADAQRTATTTGTSQNGAAEEVILEEDETPPSEEQKEAVERVMDVSGKNPRVALGVKKSTDYGSPEEDQTEILKAWRKTGMLTHSRYNSHPQARTAFKRILTVGKHFKISEADRKKLEDWDGKEELPLATIVKDSGANPNGTANQNEPTKPNDTIQQIYKEAAQYLNKLLIDPVDEPTLGRLRAMNDKIKTQNEKDGVSPAEQWTIDVGGLGAQFNKAKPFYDRLLKDEHDEEAKRELENISAEMAKSYPDIFFVPIPTPEERDRAKAERERVERERVERERVERERVDGERVERERVERERVERERAEEEAKRKGETGKIKYPWTTHILPDGREIIAGRQHSRRGKIGSQSTLVVASDQGEDPTFVITTGAAIGARETDVYFGLSGIKLLAEKRSNGEKAKTWTWRDEDHFVALRWVAVATINMHTFGKGSRSAVSQCCVEMDYGLDICTKSDLTQAIKEKPAHDQINAYCERKGITPPWDVEAQNEKVPKEKKLIAAQTWLAEQGLGNFAPPAAGFNSGAGYSTSGWTTVNSTSGNSTAGSSDIKLLTERIDAMEKQIRTQSSNTGGSSLDSLLKKMDSMEANMNKRLDTMETKITQVDALTTNMNNLSSIVGLLMEKAGLNAASA